MGRDVGLLWALRVTVLGSAANMLPSPGSVLIRMQTILDGHHGTIGDRGVADGRPDVDRATITLAGTGQMVVGGFALGAVVAAVDLVITGAGLVLRRRRGLVVFWSVAPGARDDRGPVRAGRRHATLLHPARPADRRRCLRCAGAHGAPAVATAAGVFPTGVRLAQHRGDICADQLVICLRLTAAGWQTTMPPAGGYERTNGLSKGGRRGITCPAGGMMSFSVSWRRRVAAVGLVLAATAGVLAVRTTLPGADAQTGASATFVFSDEFHTTNSNGGVNLGVGRNDGILGIACTGAAPRNGGNIPADVMTELFADKTIVRILRPNRTPLASRTVRINCVVELELAAAGADAVIEEFNARR